MIFPTCKRGHPRTPESTYRDKNGRPHCHPCRILRDRERHARIAAERPPKQLPTHCKHGHEYTQENTIFRDGWRDCRECRRARTTRSQTENPEQWRAYKRTRRARKHSQLGSFPLPEAEFIGLLYETDPHCYYCRKPLEAFYHVDHKIPLARPEMKPAHWAGLHDFRNLRLACVGCNTSKGAKTPEEFRCQ